MQAKIRRILSQISDNELPNTRSSISQLVRYRVCVSVCVRVRVRVRVHARVCVFAVAVSVTPLDSTEDSMSYVKIVDVGRKVIANRVESYISRRIQFFLSGLHIVPRCGDVIVTVSSTVTVSVT